MNERELLKRLVEASNEAYSFEQLGELCDPIAEDAKDLLAQPERKPQWSDQPPTAPGWYWFKSPQQSFDDPVWVGNGEVDTTNGYTYPIDQYRGQWAGPLTPPEE